MGRSWAINAVKQLGEIYNLRVDCFQNASTKNPPLPHLAPNTHPPSTA